MPALSGKALQSYNLFFIPANFSAKIFVNPFPGRSPRQLFFKSECKVSDFIFTHQIFLKVFVKENYNGLVNKWVRLVIGGRAGALSGSGGEAWLPLPGDGAGRWTACPRLTIGGSPCRTPRAAALRSGCGELTATLNGNRVRMGVLREHATFSRGTDGGHAG